MGGAFYSYLKDRTYRIQWPGWEHVFQTGMTNWTYDPQALGIPYLNATGGELDTNRVRGVAGNEIYVAYPPNTEVGVVNDLNTRQITEPKKVAEIEKFKHVFFHSNRGPTTEMFAEITAKHKWAMKPQGMDQNYAEAYRCVFEALFRPTEEFLSSTHKGIGRDAVPFSHIVKVAENPDATAMAFHYRVDDVAATVDGQDQVIDDETIARIIRIAGQHRVAGKNMNLFFVTNSNSSAYKVIRNASVQEAFHGIYSQELTATIHVNTEFGHGESKAREAVLSTLQAMRDWWIMRLSDILICQLSGFCKSAALVAPLEQIRYEDAGLSPRAWYWVMCGGRFC
jgi:hypothetical protein